MFKPRGLLILERKTLNLSDDDLFLLALDNGAEDISFDDEEVIEIYTLVNDFQEVKEKLEAQGLNFESAKIAMIPENLVEIFDLGQAESLLKLLEHLEDHDDVQDTFTNFDIADEIMEQLELNA